VYGYGFVGCVGSGDPDAARDFVRRFQHRVFGQTFSILRDRGAAEEAAQESSCVHGSTLGLRPSTRKQPQEDAVEEQVVDSELLRGPLARLPADQRRALVLAVFYGFTAREIGELDGVPLGTVKTRIRSAMLKLRSQLKVSDDR
jgi:RNA polymerase sigma factor (sigma-70 family)